MMDIVKDKKITFADFSEFIVNFFSMYSTTLSEKVNADEA